MLKSLGFKPSEGRLVRQGGESFVAEVVRGRETLHYLWFNPDHERPFPSSAARLIQWLQTFDAHGASPLTLRELDERAICPPASTRPLLP